MHGGLMEVNKKIFNPRLIAYLEKHRGHEMYMIPERATFRFGFYCALCNKHGTIKKCEFFIKKYRPNPFAFLDEQELVNSLQFWKESFKFLKKEYSLRCESNEEHDNANI